MNKLSQIEVLLFVSGNEGVTLEELAHVIGCSTSETYDLIQVLIKKYHDDELSGMSILEVGNVFLLTTKQEYSNLLKKFAASSVTQSLSQAAIECLAIVAYKQPITRIELEEIRGVNSSGSIQRLISRQLITEKGRKDSPGRPILYGTTPYFLDYFGLKDLSSLPAITELEEEAEKAIPNDLFFDRFKEKFDEIDSENKTEMGE
ncbi:SMC-Scp complex subunit ScpB [Vagococcus silagei]|uniref:Segregation and condensation protein B n=1 Tax=Vagococcus silagei TaxID=2508885 RepID=A0A4V3TV63_9ENTE|nr:SMC-Scp complex subunit ScpB [Vagococcus silagei]THB61659.1 SMC-Scp complex subunit ScpB [Vagococcus silagei]